MRMGISQYSRKAGNYASATAAHCLPGAAPIRMPILYLWSRNIKKMIMKVFYGTRDMDETRMAFANLPSRPRRPLIEELPTTRFRDISSPAGGSSHLARITLTVSAMRRRLKMCRLRESYAKECGAEGIEIPCFVETPVRVVPRLCRSSSAAQAWETRDPPPGGAGY